MGNSLKKEIIRSFAITPSIDVMKGNQVILITAAGLITGTVYDGNDPEETKIIKGAPTVEQAAKIYQGILVSIKKDFVGEVSGDDGFLLLTNASVKTSNDFTYNLGNIVVFYDQIIGVSLGSIS